MYSSTLTSFAMLKVKIDQGGDYLEYLRPFVLHVLSEHQDNENITAELVKEEIVKDFGMVIPARTVEVMLKRLSKEGIITREDRTYHISGQLPDDSNLNMQRGQAERHINSVVYGLMEFSKNTRHPFQNEDDAVAALCAFLEKFEILCLRAFLRNTTIPDIKGGVGESTLTVVGKYVLNLHKREPALFDSFMVVVQGHMLANALLCPDLEQAPKTFKEVSFYLDTPVLIKLLGLVDKSKEAASKELLHLLKRLDSTLAVFRHTKEELDGVIKGSIHYLDRRDARGEIVMESRRANRSKSDLLLIAETLDERLDKLGVVTELSPGYNEKFQISETAFEGALDQEIRYLNPHARLHDVNAVRSIYALRAGKRVKRIEDCAAVFVSSNYAFANAADTYGREHEYKESQEVSTVITDNSLVNLVWLKLPMEAVDLPKKEVLAYAYASQIPSTADLKKVLDEADKLAEEGVITPEAHRILRRDFSAQVELAHQRSDHNKSLSKEDVQNEVDNSAQRELHKKLSVKFKPWAERLSGIVFLVLPPLILFLIVASIFFLEVYQDSSAYIGTIATIVVMVVTTVINVALQSKLWRWYKKQRVKIQKFLLEKFVAVVKSIINALTSTK